MVNGEPENSINAFQTAIHHNADGLEFDIHLTSDRKFICFHDDTLHKIGRSESIDNLTLTELTSIEIAEGVNIPSLEEILELFGNKILMNIELKTKNDGIIELIDTIDQYNIKKDPTKLIISSYDPITLLKIKEYDPTVPTGLICDFTRGKINIARKIGCTAIHPFYGKISKDFTKISYFLSTILFKYYVNKCFNQARKLDILVNPFGVNDEKYLSQAIKKGVFAIITDEVEKALFIRNK